MQMAVLHDLSKALQLRQLPCPLTHRFHHCRLQSGATWLWHETIWTLEFLITTACSCPGSKPCNMHDAASTLKHPDAQAVAAQSSVLEALKLPSGCKNLCMLTRL